jgi:hypothetical protein
MTPEWFTEAIEGAIYEVLREKLASLRYRLENWVNPPPPNPYAQYFSRVLLDGGTEELHLANLTAKALSPRKAKTIKFFQK